MKLDKLTKEIWGCNRCELYKTKTNYVIGQGDENTNIMFIGEAPGHNEDLQGLPFVGKAGQIFDELLGSINLNRGDVYICNLLKCRPPNNRQPEKTEIESCSHFLNTQIDIIKPKVICCMGNFATTYIMKKYGMTDKITGISKLHGKIFKFSGLYGTIDIIPLYHPAVATYAPEMKEALLNDFKILKEKE